MKNIIFYFSGTGNGLKLAKDMAQSLDHCEIETMGIGAIKRLEGQYDRIGFVYPTYFWGVPKRVREFINGMDFGDNQGAYYFAIASYGGFVGNALRGFQPLMKNKDIDLQYGRDIHMAENYILMYNTGKDFSKVHKKADEIMKEVIVSINKKEKRLVKKPILIMAGIEKMLAKRVFGKVKDFKVSNTCNGCGTCEKICPMNNILMIDEKPVFGVACEQCVGCIQFCPKQAINYKNKTQSRGRYINPLIGVKDIMNGKHSG